MSENIEQKVKELLTLQQLQIETLKEERDILKHQVTRLEAALKNLEIFSEFKT